MAPRNIADQISIAWTEGRLENVLERQKQLLALHTWITQRSKDLIDALKNDVGATTDSATAELTASLDSIRELYSELDFPQTLKQERHIKDGGRQASFRVPLGPTVVAQAPFSPVFSSLVPLATALASGNPTVVLCSAGSVAANKLLAEAVRETLDREAFHFEEDSSDAARQRLTQIPYVLAVSQDLKSSNSIGPLVRRANTGVRFLEPYFGVPVGLVDRSASTSLDTVLQHISRTASSVASANPLRVPRLYLIDETVLKRLKERISASQLLTLDSKHEQEDLDKWLRKHYASTAGILSSANDQQDGKRPLSKTSGTLVRGADGTEILLVPTRSLDHSIDLTNKINAGTGAQAIYIFAGGKEAFYLGNFITASHIFVNEIPLESLAMVSARSTTRSIDQAYTIDDFSGAKHFVQTAPSVVPGSARRPGKIHSAKVKQFQGGRISYFEQGLVVGAAMGLVTIVGLGLLTYRGYHMYFVRR